MQPATTSRGAMHRSGRGGPRRRGGLPPAQILPALTLPAQVVPVPRSPATCARSSRWRIAVLVIAALPVAAVAPRVVLAAPPVSGEARRLVAQLGDEQFAAREQATQALIKLGPAAHAALEEGSRHLDREVRYRCERILILVRQVDLENRLQAFLNDAGSGRSHDFPAWEPFSKEYGDSRDTRATFVEMQRAEPELLGALLKGPRPALEALLTRTQELQQLTQTHSQELPVGSIAALLFVAAAAGAETNQAAAQTVFNFCYQGPFRNSIQAASNKDILRRLLGAWIRRGEDFQAYQGVMLALQYDLKDGLVPAERLIKNVNIQAQMKQYAVVAFAKMGNESHVPLLESLLADDKSCGTWQVNNVNITTQLRDVALAALVHLTGQEHKLYGFDRLQMAQPYVFNPITAGFETPEKRNQALEKWRAYRARTKEQPVPPRQE